MPSSPTKPAPPVFFISKEGIATFWFLSAIGSVIGSGIYVERIAATAGLRPQYVLLSNPDVLPVIPIEEPTRQAEILEELTRLAVDSMFNKTPEGLDDPDRCQRILTPSAWAWLDAQFVAPQRSAFQQRTIHQKVEIESILYRPSAEPGSTSAVVKGQLLRTGVFEGKIFNEVWSLDTCLVWTRNDCLRDCARYPLAVHEVLWCKELPVASSLQTHSPAASDAATASPQQ